MNYPTRKIRSAATATVLAALMVAAGCSSNKTSTSSSTSTSTPSSPSTTLLPAKYQGKTLNVAVDATYPPDEFVQGSQIVGFDADLIKAIAQVLGTQVHLERATFDTIIPGIVDGKFDVGNSSFTDNKTREKQVDFVDYFTAGEGYYVRANSTATFNGLAALCGHTVAVESGTTEQTDAQTQGKSCHVTVLSFGDQNQANLAVSSGRAEVGFLDSQVAAYVVHISNGQFKLTGTPFSTAPYGFALPKNSGLAPAFLSAVKTIMANGAYMQILDRWGVQAGAITNPTINGATS